jgi:hypothetical protein
VRGADGRPGAAAVDGLLPRVACGDEEAFAGVCAQVSGAVYGLVLRIVGDQSRAEQVAEEVLVEVWRSASRFSPAEGSGLSWVMTMARRRAMSHAAAGDGRAAGLRPSEVVAERAAGSLLTHRGFASGRSARRCSWRPTGIPGGRPLILLRLRLIRWPSNSVTACWG